MTETRLQFGAKSSADVKLFLTGPLDKKYAKNPVYLHSQILKRLKGFEAKFSDRWEPYKSTEIRVTTSHSFDHYLKCIEIMYGEPVDFPNIEECLAILTIASEMAGDECINKCMEYLEAVRWSAEEESQIRKVLSSELNLKLKISPDLAARLHQEDEDDDDINFVEKSIEQMMCLLKGKKSSLSKNREIVQKDLTFMLEGNTSRDVLDVCERVVLQEFQASIDSRKANDIRLLFNLIQHCNGEILKASFRAFCEDAEFLKFVQGNLGYPFHTEPVFDITMWLMKATGDGKIIISRASRLSFLTTWLPIMGKVLPYNAPLSRIGFLDRAVLSVVESLPQVDQKRICLLWTEVYTSNNIDIATPFTLSQHLQQAHSKFTANK